MSRAINREDMSDTAFAACWGAVSSALQPLLRDAIDGDMGFRWNTARSLRPLVDECEKASLTPHVEVLRLFEIQFGLRHALSRVHDGLAFKKQTLDDMRFVEEVTRADAAITDATLFLLSLPPTVRRRSSLSLIKSLYNLTFLESSAIALLAVVSASHVSGLRQMYSGRDGVEKKALLELVNMSLYEFDLLFREDRTIVKDGMVSVEGDYSVYVTQAASFIKVLHGAALTSEEKDGLRHTVFYNAQFRSDLHAATRAVTDADSVPSTPSARARLENAAAAASGRDSASSSEEEEADGKTGAGAVSCAVVEDDCDGSGNVPLSAAKACMTGRPDLQGDDTPSSPGFSDALSPYRCMFVVCDVLFPLAHLILPLQL